VNIFTYGSLMYLPVWERVVTGKYDSAKAAVSGFARKKVTGETYPGLVRATGDRTVAGVIYFGVSDEDVALLDVFEGEHYKRIEVKCATADGALYEAEVYLFLKEFAYLMDAEEWSQSDFEAGGMQRFLA
jgi:gamma-glutamylcyclotransferase (GGCT)/AIG2-like uncharacterized protein YtfP